MHSPERVFVYRNIRTLQYSVKALTGPNRGRVIARGDMVVLQDAEFRVSEAGRQRVLRERVKNVHAGVVGVLEYAGEVRSDHEDEGEGLTYNPYKYPTFVRRVDYTPVTGAARVLLRPEGVVGTGVR